MRIYKIILSILILAIIIIPIIALLYFKPQLQFNTLTYLVIILVGIGAAYAIGIKYFTKRIKKAVSPQTRIQKKYELLHVIVVISIGLTFLIGITVETEYVPSSSSQNLTKFKNMSVVIDSPSVFLIPIKSVFNPVTGFINASINNFPTNVQVESVKLYSPNYSFITIPQIELKQDHKKSHHYSANIEAKHNGEIFSINNTYVIDVSYWNDTNKTQSYHNLIPLKLKVQSLDMSIVTYFWIVMIGVVVSRFISFVLTELNIIERATQEGMDPIEIEKLKDNILKIDEREALWIIFSFIISILLFSGFKETLDDLTTVVLFNVSIAFGFGFAFDRTLELATRFKSIYTQE